MTKILLALMILSWLLIAAITDHYLPWLSWHGEALATMSLIFGCFAYISAVPRNERNMGLPMSCAPPLLVLAVAALQAISGLLLYPSDTILLALYVVQYVLSCYLGYELMTHGSGLQRRTLETGAAFFSVFGLILAAETFSRALDAGWLSNWIAGVGPMRRPGSNLSQPNHLATMLGWTYVSLLYLYSIEKINGILLSASATLVLMALAITESRTGLVSLFLLTTLAIGMGLARNSRERCLLIAGFIFYVFIFVSWPRLWEYINLLEDTKAGINATTSGRSQLWAEALEAIQKNLIAGSGYRQFALAHMSVIGDQDNVLVATYSHNLVLDIVIWFGMPFAMLLFGLMSRWLVTMTSAIKDLLGKLLLLFLIPLITHSFLEYPYTYTYFVIPVGFVVGAIEGKVAVSRLLKKISIMNGTLVLVFATLASYVAYEYFQLEEDLRLARFASAKVGEDPIGHVDFDPFVLTQLGELVNTARYKPHCNMRSDEIARIYRVSRIFPWQATLGKYAAVAKLNAMLTEYERTMIIIKAYYGQGGAYKVEERIVDYEKGCNK